MPLTVINNGDSGLNTRNALNSMFADLYGALVIPTKLDAVNANTTLPVLANAFIEYIAISGISGAPTIKIGTAPNGGDIVPATAIGNFNLTQLQQYFLNAATLYITISGGGSVNMRFGVINNFY